MSWVQAWPLSLVLQAPYFSILTSIFCVDESFGLQDATPVLWKFSYWNGTGGLPLPGSTIRQLLPSRPAAKGGTSLMPSSLHSDRSMALAAIGNPPRATVTVAIHAARRSAPIS